MHKAKVLISFALWTGVAASAAMAQPLDPELVPPDVLIPAYSLPAGSTAPTNTAPATSTPASTPSNTGAGSNASAPGMSQGQPTAPIMPARNLVNQVTSPPGTQFNNQLPGNAFMYQQAGQQMQQQQQQQQQQQAGGQQQTGATPAATQQSNDPVVVIQTTKGPITARLFREHAPNTVANFLDLVQKGFYNGITWHRVVQGFCIQAGCPKGDGSGGYIDPATNQERRINIELNPRLKHNAAGVLAMARFGDDLNSASSQFYITLSPQAHLDGKYAIFGGVINGMDTVMRITKGDRIMSVAIQQ